MQKAFLFEFSLYSKEGRKIQGSNLRYSLLVILKIKNDFVPKTNSGSPVRLQEAISDASKLMENS